MLAFVLPAAGVGALQLSTATALLVGAHVGTSTPALLTLRRGTSNAKRLALGHVSFHALSGAFGLVLLVISAPVIGNLPGPLAQPAVALATLYSLVLGAGVFVALAANGPLVQFLEARFSKEDADGFRAQLLDESVDSVPSLAAESLTGEMCRVSQVARRLAHTVLTGERLTQFRVERDLSTVAGLEAAIDLHAGRLEQAAVTAGVAGEVERVRRAARCYMELAERSVSIRTRQLDRDGQVDPQMRARMQQVQHAVLHLLAGADALRPGFQLERSRGELEAVQAHIHDLRFPSPARRRPGLARGADGRDDVHPAGRARAPSPRWRSRRPASSARPRSTARPRPSRSPPSPRRRRRKRWSR